MPEIRPRADPESWIPRPLRSLHVPNGVDADVARQVQGLIDCIHKDARGFEQAVRVAEAASLPDPPRAAEAREWARQLLDDLHALNEANASVLPPGYVADWLVSTTSRLRALGQHASL